MYLQNLRLINFKNYSEITISLCKKLNVFTGPNGSGKTNLLDAIYYLSSGRSALNPIDTQNINHDETFFNITGVFEKEDKKYTVSCQLQKGLKKTVWINKKKVEKISEFIGTFPAVLITPDDNEIIKEGSEIRRSFFDNIFSQIDRHYLESLIDYSRALKIRNSLLKQFAETKSFDKDLLEPYNRILAEKGTVIYNSRTKYLAEFTPSFSYYFNKLSGAQEEVFLDYRSSLMKTNLLDLLNASLQEDRLLQRTTVGIHKDDFMFSIGNHPLKKFGSQGQQKSFLIALKLAHHSVIKRLKNINPVLLLDDIFDKLDDKRIIQLTEIVLDDSFGQVFITDARTSNSLNFFQNLNMEKNIFLIHSNLPHLQ